MWYDTFKSSGPEQRDFSCKKWLKSLCCCCKAENENEVVIRHVSVRSRMRTNVGEESVAQTGSSPRAGGFYGIFVGDPRAN